MRLSATCAALLALRAVALEDAESIILDGVEDGSNYYQQIHPLPHLSNGTCTYKYLGIKTNGNINRNTIWGHT
jgi:hypothetical protein